MIDYIKNEVQFDFSDKYQILINYFLPFESNHIFNTLDFFYLHSKNIHDKYIQLSRKSDDTVFATIIFYSKDNNSFLSPEKGTFGGVSAKKGIDFLLLEEFLKKIIDFLSNNNHPIIKIKLQPFSHDQELCSKVINILLRHNFYISSSELNYSVNIDDANLIDRFSYGNQKKLKQCIRDGFLVSELDIKQYHEAYEVIRSNREAKGYSMTMDLPGFMDMADIFTDKIHCFAVYSPSSSSMIASSICISINSDVLYVFYWGDVQNDNSYSPITFLASYIYDYAKENLYKVIDVGTSSINSEPIYGLINFKRNLGFKESLKLSLEFLGEAEK